MSFKGLIRESSELEVGTLVFLVLSSCAAIVLAGTEQ